MGNDDNEKLLRFLRKHMDKEEKPRSGHGFVSRLFEETAEEKSKKQQFKFEKVTHENFQAIYDEVIGIWNLLVDFYEKHEGEFVEKEKIQAIFKDSEKLINEIVEREQKNIDKLKERLIEVIKEYKRKSKILDKTIKDYDVSMKKLEQANFELITQRRRYEQTCTIYNNTIEELNRKIIEFNEKITKVNEGR